MTVGTLPVAVELLVNGTTWTDVTSYAYRRDQITITRGQSAQGQTTDPGQCSLSLKNKDGRFTPRNPTGPYYGKIGRNTQLRASAFAGTPWLGLPDDLSADVRATTPDASALDIVGDIDLRFDIAPTHWGDPGTVELGGKWASPSQQSWYAILSGGKLFLQWTTGGSAATQHGSASASIYLPPLVRQSVRITLDVNNGASGYTVTYYTGPSLAGPWTQLGTPDVHAGTTSIFSSTAALELGDISALGFGNAPCRMYGAEIRNGIAGTVVASPSFSAQAAGALTFTDAAGRAWTASSSTAITNKQIRGVFEVAEWPPRWDPSGGDAWVPIVGAGILKRLGGTGQNPLHSPMRRDVTSPARSGIVAYWPMEDGSDATTIASGLSGGSPMRITAGTPSLAADDSWVASEALPTLSGAVLSGSIPTYTSTGTVYARMYASIPKAGLGSDQKLFSVSTLGTVATWTLYVSSAGDLYLHGLDSTGAIIVDSTEITFGMNGRPALYDLTLVQNGTGIDWNLVVTYLDASTLDNQVWLFFNGTKASATLGRATAVRVGEGAGLGDSVVGHLAVATDINAFNSTINAALGWAGEAAIDRIARLSAEESISMHAAGDPAQSTLVGPQTTDTLLVILQAAADADGGLLYEQREALGLCFRGRDTLFNQAPRLSMDYRQPGPFPPLEPTDDTQNVVNDLTVSRDQAGSSRATVTTGPLSTLAPPNGVGPIPAATSLNLFTDDQTVDAAGWGVHVGTWDEARYPSIPVDLRRLPTPDQQSQAAALDTGDGLQITSMPTAWLAPGSVNQLVLGYSETIWYTWITTYACVPAGPYTVAVLEDPNLSRLDTDGSSLHTAINATATSMSVDVTAGPLWTTAGGDFPLDVVMGGEQITVGMISGTSSPQTFSSLTRSVNGVVKSQTVGSDIRLAQPMILSPGGTLTAFAAGQRLTAGMLADGVTPTQVTGTVTAASGFVLVQSSLYKIGGHLAMIYVQLTTTNALTASAGNLADVICCTIPAGYRPLDVINVVIGNGLVGGEAVVDSTTGQVQLRAASDTVSAGSNIRFAAMFVSAL